MFRQPHSGSLHLDTIAVGPFVQVQHRIKIALHYHPQRQPREEQSSQSHLFLRQLLLKWGREHPLEILHHHSLQDLVVLRVLQVLRHGQRQISILFRISWIAPRIIETETHRASAFSVFKTVVYRESVIVKGP